MKIPYKEEPEICTAIVLVSIVYFSYSVVVSIPDPTQYFVTPTLLWEVCYVILKISIILTMTWPTSIPIWFYSVVSIVDCLVNPSNVKVKTGFTADKDFDAKKYLESKGLLAKYEKAKLLVEASVGESMG